MRNQPVEIARLQAIQSKVLQQRSFAKASIAMDIGDDAFAFHPPKGLQVIAQDMMVEHVHFKSDYFSASDLGWKSIAVNLSDLAAKGAEAFAVQISLALPPSIDDHWLEAFYKGALEICEKYNVIIAGGDLCAAKNDIVIDVSVYGFADHVFTRGGLEVGDVLLSSGELGLATLGFKYLNSKDQIKEGPQLEVAIQKHLRPQPRLDLVKDLQKNKHLIHATIDLSDGLVNECSQLLRASIQKSNQMLGIDLQANSELALWGGEDYEILIAIPAKAITYFQDWICVGTVQDKGGIRIQNAAGQFELITEYAGWSHF